MLYELIYELFYDPSHCFTTPPLEISEFLREVSGIGYFTLCIYFTFEKANLKIFRLTMMGFSMWFERVGQRRSKWQNKKIVGLSGSYLLPIKCPVYRQLLQK